MRFDQVRPVYVTDMANVEEIHRARRHDLFVGVALVSAAVLMGLGCVAHFTK